MEKKEKKDIVSKPEALSNSLKSEEWSLNMLDIPLSSSNGIERILARETHIEWLKKYRYGNKGKNEK